MRISRCGFAAFLLVGMCVVNARALDVVLVNNKRIAGEVRVDARTVYVKVGPKTYTIPRGGVKTVELSNAETLEYERRKATLPETAEAHFTLAEWLAARFRHVDAERFYESAVKLDPEHTGARGALGYRQVDGKWTRSDEDLWRVRSRWFGPEGADACVELARIYLGRGDQKRTESMLRQALIAAPGHAAALEMMRPITDQYVSKNTYRLPVEGTWAVINDHNQHHRSAAFMQYGLDFMKVDEQFRVTRVPEPTRVEDYYTWDAPIHAAADGEIYSVNDGYLDSPLGASGDFHSANTVCIRHAEGEYTVYGHLKNGSITVKKGDKVRAGDVIARGGNSGSSGWPHMHWAMYDRDGIGLPVTFSDFDEVTREGEKHVESGRLTENHVYRNTLASQP